MSKHPKNRMVEVSCTDLDPEEPDLFNVEEILDRKYDSVSKKVQYKVKWAECEETTWEKEDHLLQCEQKLSEFLATQNPSNEKRRRANEPEKNHSDEVDLSGFVLSKDELPAAKDVKQICGIYDKLPGSLHFAIEFNGGNTRLVGKTLCKEYYPKILCDYLLDRIEIAQNLVAKE